MPIKKAALKRIRADKQRYLKNSRTLSDLRTRIKSLKNLISEKKADKARSALGVIISKLDKAAQKKIMHKNKASRTISRLKRAVNSIT